jgi:hypothetical protein
MNFRVMNSRVINEALSASIIGLSIITRRSSAGVF